MQRIQCTIFVAPAVATPLCARGPGLAHLASRLFSESLPNFRGPSLPNRVHILLPSKSGQCSSPRAHTRVPAVQHGDLRQLGDSQLLVSSLCLGNKELDRNQTEKSVSIDSRATSYFRKRSTGNSTQTTDHRVSDCVLLSTGTMQFGEAIEYEEAASIMSRAADVGINFFDSAEMYPVPQRAQTQGLSEQHLGRWMKTRPRYVLYTR